MSNLLATPIASLKKADFVSAYGYENYLSALKDAHNAYMEGYQPILAELNRVALAKEQALLDHSQLAIEEFLRNNCNLNFDELDEDSPF